jgi:hypothetical protein
MARNLRFENPRRGSFSRREPFREPRRGSFWNPREENARWPRWMWLKKWKNLAEIALSWNQSAGKEQGRRGLSAWRASGNGLPADSLEEQAGVCRCAEVRSVEFPDHEGSLAMQRRDRPPGYGWLLRLSQRLRTRPWRSSSLGRCRAETQHLPDPRGGPGRRRDISR